MNDFILGFKDVFSVYHYLLFDTRLFSLFSLGAAAAIVLLAVLVLGIGFLVAKLGTYGGKP